MSRASTEIEDLIRDCEREAIHTPDAIQPHGALLAIGADNRICVASENVTEVLGLAPAALFGRGLTDVLGGETAARLRKAIEDGGAEFSPEYLGRMPVGSGGSEFHVVAHRAGGLVIVDLERATGGPEESGPDVEQTMRRFLSELPKRGAIEELCGHAAAEVRRLTGFDRVLIYRFDESWNGAVVAEARNERLPSYLDLRFPAGDIPAQARRLYALNRVRIIPDGAFRPVALAYAPGCEAARPLDLSGSTLRSVSPVHVEYMRNMGTPASMSFSIMSGGRLWGLVSCHHAEPRMVSYPTRAKCDFVCQVLALQIEGREERARVEHRAELQALRSDLLAHMAAKEGFVEGMAEGRESLLRLASAGGAAIVTGDDTVLIGETPTLEQVTALTDWLISEGSDLVATDRLSTLYPAAEACRDVASGLLALSISKVHRTFVLWFRPEVIRTVTWGGDPREVAKQEGGRLRPRRSFEAWKEIVRGRSEPWRSTELEAASELRTQVVNIVLKRAEELAQLNEQLQASNKELEAFSYSVSHDLRAPFRHIVGYAELLREECATTMDEQCKRYVNVIIESAMYAGTLVDNLLTFSQMGRAALHMADVDLASLVAEVRQQVERLEPGRRVRWEVGPLPRVRADLMMMRLVMQNLIANAFKYTRTKDEAVIEVGARTGEEEVSVFVRDNGVGFDMRYVDKLFGVFQRLHRVEEFEGTGIGLANVRRIVTRHGGRTWAEGEPGQGATFWFSLPRENGMEALPC